MRSFASDLIPLCAQKLSFKAPAGESESDGREREKDSAHQTGDTEGGVEEGGILVKALCFFRKECKA
ncbi:hypothetical protein SRHO_G00313520 [Serrasalmus rhombeus]